MFGPEQFCCLIPDIFKYENRCIILLGKKGSRGWLDCCTPVKLSTGRVGRLHQRSGRISGEFWIPCVGRCSLITLVTSPSSRGWAGFYQPICQSTRKGKIHLQLSWQSRSSTSGYSQLFSWTKIKPCDIQGVCCIVTLFRFCIIL